MPGRPLSEDAKSILLKVFQYLRKEKGRGKLIHGIEQTCKRFKAMTGYDWSTAQNLMSQSIFKNQKGKKALRKERSKRNVSSVRFNACVHGAEVPSCSSLVKSGPKPNLDSFDLAIVRRAIHSMYGQQMPVSLPGLQKWLNIHHPELKPSLSSLRRGVLRLGFKYQRGMPDKRFRGKEEDSVVAARIR